jgi:hypothetical protein
MPFSFLCERIAGFSRLIITREEIKGLMEERLYVKTSPLGTTKLSNWVHANRRLLG